MKRIISQSLFISGLIFAGSASAQIIPDSTLPVNSRVTTGCTVCIIQDGTTSGVNLFHSFLEFSIPRDGAAIFQNSPDIQNIFTRVTGSNIFNIEGLISVNGNANLSLLMMSVPIGQCYRYSHRR